MSGWIEGADPTKSDYKYGKDMDIGRDEFAGMDVDNARVRDGLYDQGQLNRANALEGDSTNRNNYFYGGLGNRGAADADAWRLRDLSERGNKLDYNNDAANAGRWDQGHALDYMKSAAEGNQPSRAEILQRQGMDSAIADQYGMAASARGGVGNQAAAMRGAMGQGAQLQAQAANQGAALRAQEMADARQQYFMGASGMRSADMQNEYQRAGLGIQNAQVNNQRLMGMTGAEQNVRQMQLNANMAYDQNNSARAQGQAKMRQDQAQFDSNRSDSWMKAGLAAGGMLLSDVNTKEDIAPLTKGASKEAIAKMLKTSPSYAYNYKEGTKGEDSERRAFGPMAQDLARTPMGKTMIVKTPQGLAVDIKRAVTMGMTVDRHLQDQIDELRKDKR